MRNSHILFGFRTIFFSVWMAMFSPLILYTAGPGERLQTGRLANFIFFLLFKLLSGFGYGKMFRVLWNRIRNNLIKPALKKSKQKLLYFSICNSKITWGDVRGARNSPASSSLSTVPLSQAAASTTPDKLCNPSLVGEGLSSSALLE